MSVEPSEVARKLRYGWALPKRIGPWSLTELGNDLAEYTAEVEIGYSRRIAKVRMSRSVFRYNILIFPSYDKTWRITARIRGPRDRRNAAAGLIGLLEGMADVKDVRRVLQRIVELSASDFPTYRAGRYKSVGEFLETFHLNGKRHV
ncbi:hypothetical protein AKJ62_01360 [candidate division MSBL1 archaeon SCGC-AAA259D14]|uniref:Uncharacterized protein n=1 Tax=candidate division MSBL1 archaeon SCGC-AAA259D14 TaxID=1698261 RepID=A0A133U7S1_9EURY|nr:hypothetical protein AKJ62_01360 [candidate division MSBL1 archaeon SCGC-AAA259D14]